MILEHVSEKTHATNVPCTLAFPFLLYIAVGFIIRNGAQVEPGREIIWLLANQKLSFEKTSQIDAREYI
jgi:hypothetical protein